MKQRWQHIDDCQNCSCNKNRECRGYRIMIDKGFAFNPYKCEFVVGRWKKPKIKGSWVFVQDLSEDI